VQKRDHNDLLLTHTVLHPVVEDEQLTDIGLVEFWDDAASVRERVEGSGRIENP
jgi:hypothetical protein